MAPTARLQLYKTREILFHLQNDLKHLKGSKSIFLCVINMSHPRGYIISTQNHFK